MILVYRFTCYYFFYRTTWSRQSLEEYVFWESLRQTSALARVETKMHFSIFANFQISRKCTKHSHFLAKMLANFTWLFLFRQNFHDNNIFFHKNTFFHSAARIGSCLAHIIERFFCENAQVEKALIENKYVCDICENLKTYKFFPKWSLCFTCCWSFSLLRFFFVIFTSGSFA